MPRDSNGNYTLPQSPFAPGTTISSSAVNSDFSDIATALTGSIAANGSTQITAPLKFPDGSEGAPSNTFASEQDTGTFHPGTNQWGVTVGGVTLFIVDLNNQGVGQNGALTYWGNTAIPSPVGMVVDFAGTAAPTGWFLCYGQAISRDNYPELFTVIGTNFGTGDGSTTFNLPDLRGRASFGKDDMGGSTAGRITNAVSGITGTTLGAAGGGQSATISQANLPNVNFTISGITLNDPTHSHFASSASGITARSSIGGSNAWAVGGFGLADLSGLSTTASSSGVSITSQGTAASGGSGTAVVLMNPALIMNKIIFAGRP